VPNKEVMKQLRRQKKVWDEAQGWLASIYVGYYKQALDKYALTDVPEMICAKYFHTYDVVEWMKTIYIKLRQKGILKRAVVEEMQFILPFVITALTHDVARPQEAIETGAHTNQHGFNHGKIGADMIANSPLNEMGIPEFERIIAAVRQHGQIKADDSDCFTLIIRDADKMASLAEIEEASGRTFSSLTIGFSEDVLSCFLAGKRFRTNQIKTRADRIVLLLSWYIDLNYDVTKELFFEERIDQRCLEILKEHLFSEGADDPETRGSEHITTFQQIEAIVAVWKSELGI